MAKIKQYSTLAVLGLVWGAMYVYPYIRYVFSDCLASTLGINETQIGVLITIYGVVSLFMYVPGGILADKLQAKKPLLLSMGWALVLLLAFAAMLSFGPTNAKFISAIAVWALMPFATAFVFWSALMKSINIAVGRGNYGRGYGFCFACNSIFGTLISAANMWVYSTFKNTDYALAAITLSVACFLAIGMIAIAILLKDDKQVKTNPESLKWGDVKPVLKNKLVWLAGIIMMLVYMLFTCTTYFTTFLTVVWGMSAEISGVLTIIRSYVIMIFASIFAGIIADRIFHSTLRWYKFAGICMAVSTLLFIVFGCSQVSQFFGITGNVYVIAAISILPGIFSTMIYAIQFSVIAEVELPTKIAGTATGLASLFVFSPDVWFNTALGAIIDTNKAAGNAELGYLIIFLILVAICLAIVALSHLLLKANKSSKTAKMQ